MRIEQVKANMGKPVRYGDSIYTLTACIMRLGKQGLFYQAEILDKHKNSVIICRLGDLGVIE